MISRVEKPGIFSLMLYEERMTEDVMCPDGRGEALSVDNAGLCLLSPWLPRLFECVGYLDAERKDFKEASAKVRAVFLLQYLAYPEKAEWQAHELMFNRLLTDFPAHMQLPMQLELTDVERKTAGELVKGVKANWPKMSGTSVEGFIRSFIARSGRLEQQESRWLLTVQDKAYDVLVDTVPWAFKQIRLPWLKHPIQVAWHEHKAF